MPEDPTPEPSDTQRNDQTANEPTGAEDGVAGEVSASASAVETATAEPPVSTASEGVPDVEVKVPEFAAMEPGLAAPSNGAMDRFYDVPVPVWAELGRIEMPLGDLVKLSEGAVLRLNRPISEPVDLVSQGVRLARGEVIVIDDCFAIRIKEIIAKK